MDYLLLIVFCMTNANAIPWESSVSAKAASHLLISEVYGGEEISVAQNKNDFIKLYNPASGDVDLAGWKMHYASLIVKK
jgi:endonuclease G